MNTYAKYCPNVYVAKCSEPHQRGETIEVETQKGKINDCIVFNLVAEKAGFYYYSIVRADGFNHQAWAAKRAERYASASARSSQKSNQKWDASREGRDFLSLGEPIKVGHHSEKRHRALIERNHNRMAASVELQRKAEQQASKAEYYEERTKEINLSMPESIDHYAALYERKKARHAELLAKKKAGEKMSHDYELTYAKKEANEAKKKYEIAVKLWGEEIDE